mmetsp:Transcript_62683/g.104214  ORF Transcript_62683/g.104214 Transcript_62683/m.104214 type:complete len:81 (+) Transcript_62683:661-903(+)
MCHSTEKKVDMFLWVVHNLYLVEAGACKGPQFRLGRRQSCSFFLQGSENSFNSFFEACRFPAQIHHKLHILRGSSTDSRG